MGKASQSKKWEFGNPTAAKWKWLDTSFVAINSGQQRPFFFRKAGKNTDLTSVTTLLLSIFLIFNQKK